MENRFYNAFDLDPLVPSAHPGREGEYRTVFEINRDRIIHTSAFRRLQSKTQVFLSGEYDFYRTRLTHSIEVAQIGRSICARLRRTSPHLHRDYFIDSDLVEAACLSHDIGHPPFGHAGERTLHRLMRPWGGFEGNAQTLRMLTETIFSGQHSGMNPSRALTDSVLKYKTLHAELDQPENHFLYTEQSNILDWVMGGRDFPLELTAGSQRDGFRSIECQIMDWADDTAYSLNDIADGINAGFITLHSVEEWAAAAALDATGAQHIERLLKSMRDGRAENRLRSRIGLFIDAASLVDDVNFLSAVTQRYRWRLDIAPEAAGEARLYKKMALDIVFRSRQLQQLEHKSDRLLTDMFSALMDRYVNGKAEHKFRLLPQFEEQQIAGAPDERSKARLVCDALARLTDGAATRMWRRLFDPEYRSITDLG